MSNINKYNKGLIWKLIQLILQQVTLKGFILKRKRNLLLLISFVILLKDVNKVPIMEDEVPQLNNRLVKKMLMERGQKMAPEYTGERSKYDNFLKAISGVESSFGANQEHPVIQEGIHAGDAAIGEYGLMPETAIDLSKKIGTKDTVLGRHLQEVPLPDVQGLSQLDKDSVKQRMQDPKVMQQLVRLLATEQELKQGGDEDKMAYTWNQGSNIPSERIKPEDLKTSPYVNKFKKLRKLMGN